MDHKKCLLNSEVLIEYNRRGLIPGPSESDDAFLARCSVIAGAQCSQRLSLYDISPDWIPIHYSDKGLMPWQGGSVTVTDEPPYLFLQVRKKLEKKDHYLGLYTKEEMIDHELVHGARLTFEEPYFEEILAYRTSHSKWRRFFGPILLTAREGAIFMGLMALLAGAGWLSVFFHSPILEVFQFAAFSAFLGTGIFGVLRLVKLQRIFHKTLKNLSALFGSHEKAHAAVLRLTDAEIVAFSRLSSEQIAVFAKEAKDTSLRWRQLYSAYFS